LKIRRAEEEVAESTGRADGRYDLQVVASPPPIGCRQTAGLPSRLRRQVEQMVEG
jgi:hypothetical protein